MNQIKRRSNRSNSSNENSCSSLSDGFGKSKKRASPPTDSVSIGSSMSCSSKVYRQGYGIGRFRFTKKGNIFKMIEDEQWTEVRKMIQTSRGRKKCMKTDTSGLSVLGLALGVHAPLDIIAEILKINPNSSMEKDMFHAVPLHIACLNGVSSNVVQHLIHHDDNKTTLLCDDDNRLPLHHAVEYAIQKGDDEDDEDVDLEVIKLLCSISPETLRMSDIHGESAIDMAQMVKVQAIDVDNPNYKRADKVYKVLKKANIRLYRFEKRRAEGLPEPEKSDKSIVTPVTEDITEDITSGTSTMMHVFD